MILTEDLEKVIRLAEKNHGEHCSFYGCAHTPTNVVACGYARALVDLKKAVDKQYPEPLPPNKPPPIYPSGYRGYSSLDKGGI